MSPAIVAPGLPGLDRASRTAERAVHRALLRAWRDVQGALPDLETAWRQADVALLVQRLAGPIHGALEQHLQAVLLQARQAAAGYLLGTPVPAPLRATVKAAESQPFIEASLAGIDWPFLNPRMVTAAQTQATQLATVESTATVDAIRQTVQRGLELGLPYDAAAALLDGTIGLNWVQARALMNLAGTLQDQGVTGPAYDRALERYADRARDYRAEMIARTEGQRASNGGAFATYQAGRDQGVLDPTLVKEWIASNQACPICAAADGQQQPIDTPFQLSTGDTLDHPPAHPNCRCKFGLAEPR